MASAALVMGAKSPVEQINDTLRGSVIDVLRVLIPTLEPYTNEEAFNVILNSPEMTARAFRAFREHPEAFAHVVQGPNQKPVSNDNEKLSCGRTLAQVVALVVQAVAKRYFRAKIGLRLTGTAKPAEPEPGLVEKLVSLLKPAQPQKAEPKKPHPSDRLFNAMRDYLLFEWQLRLIPHYVGLPVTLVTVLGSRILDYREVEDIQWMARTGQPLSRPTVKEAPKAASLMPEPAASTASIDAEVPIIPVIQHNLPEGVDNQRFVSAVLGRVNPRLARRLIQDLGLNAKQMAVVLIRAYEVLPAVEFQKFGAAEPESHEANRFIAAALTARFGAKTDPQTCLEFARLYMANVRSAV